MTEGGPEGDHVVVGEPFQPDPAVQAVHELEQP